MPRILETQSIKAIISFSNIYILLDKNWIALKSTKYAIIDDGQAAL